MQCLSTHKGSGATSALYRPKQNLLFFFRTWFLAFIKCIVTLGETGSLLLFSAGALPPPSPAASWRAPSGPRWTYSVAPWPGRHCQIYPSPKDGRCQNSPSSIACWESRKKNCYKQYKTKSLHLRELLRLRRHTLLLSLLLNHSWRLCLNRK